jgi:hypothetical protein
MLISTAGWIIPILKGNNIYKLILCCCFFSKAVLILMEPHESIHDPKNQLQDWWHIDTGCTSNLGIENWTCRCHIILRKSDIQTKEYEVTLWPLSDLNLQSFIDFYSSLLLCGSMVFEIQRSWARWSSQWLDNMFSGSRAWLNHQPGCSEFSYHLVI